MVKWRANPSAGPYYQWAPRVASAGDPDASNAWEREQRSFVVPVDVRHTVRGVDRDRGDRNV